jgi:PAS domain S-box-containing protein
VDISLSEGRYGLVTFITNSPIASVISNPRLADNPIVAVNRAFCALTGYGPENILGRNYCFISGPSTEPWPTDRIRKGTQARLANLIEIVSYKRDGTTFRNAVVVAPIFSPDGELEYLLGSQVELYDDAINQTSMRHQRAVEFVSALSPRQREILQQVADGQRSKQIASALHLSEKTVKMHRALILKKLGKHNIADAIRIAVEAGL